MMSRNLLALIVLVVLFAGCSSNTQDYFPIKPGMSWRYNVEVTTMDGIETKKYIVQAAQARPWQGQSLPVRQTLDGTRLFYLKNDDGVYRVATRRQEEKVPAAVPGGRSIVLQYPLEKGTTWQETSETIALYRTGPPQRSEYWIHAPVKLEYVIEATDDNVKVPAGRFDNCVRVHATGRTPNYDAGNYVGRTDITVDKTDWYAPGVGLVKSVRVESTTGKVLNRGSMQTFAGRLVFELEAFERG